MRTKLWRDSLENEAVESWSFRVRFSGRGTLYVQIPGKWHIRDESRVPPGHLNLLCGGRTGLMVRASDSGSGDPGSILGRVGVFVSLSKRHLLPKSTGNTQE